MNAPSRFIAFPWIGAGALFLASCGPSEETCRQCGDLSFAIDTMAIDARLDTTGICGDSETGEGTQPGFEDTCEQLRSSCGFSPQACNGDGDLFWAHYVTSSPPPEPMCDNGVTEPGQAGCSTPCGAGEVCQAGVCGLPVDAIAVQIDPAHTGALPGPALAATPCERWSVPLGSGVSSYLVIAGGRVFVTTVKPGDPFGSRLHAYDLRTGSSAWGPVELGWDTNATADGGKLFTLDADGAMQAFDAATGAPLWSVTGGATGNAPPTAAGGHLYVVVGTGATPASSRLIQLDEATGAKLWTASADMGESAPTIAGGAVYVGGNHCELVASFDEATGDSRWLNGEWPFFSGGTTTVLFDGKLYVHSATNLHYIFDAETGEYAGSLESAVSPVFQGGRAYVVNEQGILEARDAATLAVAWTFDSDHPVGTLLAGEAAVYAMTKGGVLYALDPQTGDSAWSTQFMVSESGTTFAVSAGVLVVAANGRLTAFW